MSEDKPTPPMRPFRIERTTAARQQAPRSVPFWRMRAFYSAVASVAALAKVVVVLIPAAAPVGLAVATVVEKGADLGMHLSDDGASIGPDGGTCEVFALEDRPGCILQRCARGDVHVFKCDDSVPPGDL